ncbi:MAG: hypothetical protein IKU94_00650 [Bacteroidaceae bacterium]|nr:hypothetical protein [Bacteroidaceae bacterium]MBR4930454.1 hypothetical protein [Bacteroidaceae bacterium]
MIDITPLINVLIALFATVVASFVLPWVSVNTTAKQRENLVKWAEIAVAAAQQLYHQESGTDRLEYALELMESKGFNIDDGSVRDAIEAAVLKLHQGLGDIE